MEIIATKRTEQGRKAKQLRKDRKIPVVMFGPDIESEALTIGLNEFVKVYREAGETQVIYVNVDGKKTPVLVKEVQYEPISDAIIHVSFYNVNLKEKTTAEIPVEVINEEGNPLIKSGEAMILVLITEITVEALPMDLPHAFEIDAATLKDYEHSITLNDLVFDRSKVELSGYEDLTEAVVKLERAQMEEEVEEVVDEAAAIEGIEATAEVVKEEEEETKE